jgi:hypothetical protein
MTSPACLGSLSRAERLYLSLLSSSKWSASIMNLRQLGQVRATHADDVGIRANVRATAAGQAVVLQ